MRTNWNKIFDTAFAKYGGYSGTYYVDKRKDGTRRIKMFGTFVGVKDKAWHKWRAAEADGGAALIFANALRANGFTVLESKDEILEMGYSGLTKLREGVIIVVK